MKNATIDKVISFRALVKAQFPFLRLYRRKYDDSPNDIMFETKLPNGTATFFVFKYVDEKPCIDVNNEWLPPTPSNICSAAMYNMIFEKDK